MINSKHIKTIVVLAMIMAIIISMGMFFEAGTYTGKTTDYQKKLFNGEVVDVSITVSEDDWNSLLENATAKEYVSADITLNGDLFSSVGVRTKGNSSLTQVASSDSDRYSLQLNPNKYVDGQSFYGLDTLAINNIVSDTTYMKDDISYDIMEYLGVPTPLRNYAKVTVNGEYYGFCLLLERYDNTFLDRTYNSTTGELYNVKTGGMGGGGMQQGDQENNNQPTADNAQDTTEMQDASSQEITQEQTTSSSDTTQQATAPQDGQQAGNAPPGGQGNAPPNGQQGGNAPPDGQGTAPDGQAGNTPPDGEGTTPPDGQQGTAPANLPSQSDSAQSSSSEQSSTAEDTTQNMAPATDNAIDTNQPPDNMGGGMGGGMESSSNGGGLQYTDDDPESYSAIFDNAVSSKVSDKDKEQVIAAIKALNEGTDIEEYWDVDEILRYFAAHTFVVNLDSYVSNMQQNYYILEKNGVLSILPWDYNLAFGGFNSGNASDVVNFPIDTPVSGVSMEDRPLLNQLLSVEEYKEKYHEYLNDIVEGYVGGGLFEERVSTIQTEIDSYVENDTTSFYSYEEYQTGVQELIKIVDLRAESIKGQLDGTIPSTTQGQKDDSSALIDSSSVTLSKLGTQGGGNGGGGGGGGPGGNMDSNMPNNMGQNNNTNNATTEDNTASDTTQTQTDDATQNNQNNPLLNLTQEQMEQLRTLQETLLSGDLTDEEKEQLAQLGISEEQLAQFSQMMGNNQGGGPGGDKPDMQNGSSSSQQVVTLTTKDWIFYGILALLLIGGILFIAKTPRHKYKK